jgi:hypothetical protein
VLAAQTTWKTKKPRSLHRVNKGRSLGAKNVSGLCSRNTSGSKSQESKGQLSGGGCFKKRPDLQGRRHQLEYPDNTLGTRGTLIHNTVRARGYSTNFPAAILQTALARHRKRLSLPQNCRRRCNLGATSFFRGLVS